MASTAVEEAVQMDPQETEQLEQLVYRIANFVEAIGHPIRLRIMAWAYAHPDERVSAVKFHQASDGAFGLGIVAYHVRKLRAAKLLRLVGEKRVRGAVEHLYVLSAAGRAAVERAHLICEEPAEDADGAA